MPISEAMMEALKAQRARPEAPARPGAVRVVIDTNVLLDFWVFRDPQASALLSLLESGRIAALRSPETEEEFAEVIGRDAFGLPPSAQREIMEAWFALSIRAQPAPAPARCRDPLDQKFLDLAAGGHARVLVSKDKLVLKAGRALRRCGILALRPAEAARELFPG